MDIDKIKTTLKNNFVDITSPSDEVFRATKKHEQGVYQVHYFDFSQNLMNKDFDFDRYQRELLVSDYYSVEGALQWNFYLHFLVDEKYQSEPHFNSVKYIIEADRRLARKSVSTYAEFKKSLKPSRITSEPGPIDIVDRWKGLLEEELLNVLDEKIAMKSVVNSYIDGTQDKRAAPKKTLVDVKNFPLISELKFERYRLFPKQREFKFGRVNLISGPNAVGKTSLLEALELMVCGNTLRNSESGENFHFHMTPMGNLPSYQVKRESDVEYRSRDHVWYGRNYSRGNELIKSFARFNFFDTDAAVRFSERIDSGGGLSKTLTQIVFGPDADRLFERIYKIRNRFNDERKYFERNIKTDRETQKSIELELQSKIKADTEILSQELIFNRLEKLNVGITNYEIVTLEEFLRKIANASLSVAAWKIATERFGVHDYSSFETVIDLIRKSIDELSQCELNKTILVNKENHATELLRISQRKFECIDRLQAYLSSGALDLPALEFSKKGFAKDVQLFDKAIRSYNEVNKKDLNIFSNLTLLKAKEQSNKNLVELREKESINHQKLQGLRKTLDKTSLIIKEIRTKAIDYVEALPNVSECPLCGTDLKPNKLAHRLDKPLKTLDSSKSDIDSFLETSSEISNLKINAERQRVSLDLLHQAVEFIPQLRDKDNTISELLVELDCLREIQGKKKGEYEVQKRKIEKYNEDGFLAEELEKLQKELDVDFASNELRELLEERAQKARDIVTNSNRELKSYLNDKNKQSERVKNIKATCNALSMADSSSMHNLTKELKDVFSEVQGLSNILSLSQHDTAASVDRRLMEAKELVGSFLRSLAEQKTFEDLTKSNDTLKNTIEIYLSKSKRADHASRLLTKLLEKEKPEILLVDFLTQHAELISDIFNQIHSPREFEDVRLLNGELFTKRKTDGQDTPLNKLSTGQRTALVLSVFLSMNKMITTGPRLLIFDDPVTYVDDLNVLSFIDHILQISERKDRQIFFATANQRIASLFAKKFDFLKNEPDGFKTIELCRV